MLKHLRIKVLKNMEELKNKMEKGTYATINSTKFESKPKVSFEFGKPEVVTMACESPKEIDWEDGVFYVFDCYHNGELKVIKSSAYSFIRGMKEQEPYLHKRLNILKVMEAGKQRYIVTEFDAKTKEEEVK